MNVCDIQRGKTTTVEIEPTGAKGFGVELKPKGAVDLKYSEMMDSILLERLGKSWEVKGIDKKNQAVITRQMSNNQPKLCWVAAVSPKTGHTDRVLVQIHELARLCLSTEDIEIGVEEKIVDQARNKIGALNAVSAIVEWLNEQFLLPGKSGSSRVLLSGSPHTPVDQMGAFRLFGKGFAIDVRRDDEEKLSVSRIVESRKPAGDEENLPIILVEGKVRFADYTMVGRFRGSIRTELDQLVASTGSYLGVWRKYNALEKDRLLRRARDFGWLTYYKRDRVEGSWRFFLSDNNDLEAAILRLRDSEEMDLEVAESPPPELEGKPPRKEKVEPDRPRKRRFFGTMSGFDPQNRTMYIRVPEDREDEEAPGSGVIFLSLSGDAKRLERRERAQTLITLAECPMPQLGLILENQPIRIRHVKKEKPLSAAAKDIFDGEPTARQIEALNVALNTPDIALIQGPPGTGKTRVIAALQTRLAETSDSTAGLSGRFLLTSYQHDAVENVANATQVYGLPAIKVGRKRGHAESDGFEGWRQDRLGRLHDNLRQIEDYSVAKAYRRVRDMLVGYLKAPRPHEDTIQLLRDLMAVSKGFVPKDLEDRLIELLQNLKFSGASGNLGDSLAGDQALATKAVRGIRVEHAAFEDDGSTNAYKVLRRLEKTDVLGAVDIELLEQAASWQPQDPLDFLDDLREIRDRLLERLLPENKLSSTPRINADVEDILKEVTEALFKSVRESRSGIDAVLQDFCDDLEYDVEGTRDAVKHYTAVFASTCQQVVSYQMGVEKGDDLVFDSVVVDEAARANPLDLFIPMSLAERRIVLVGDHRQLPHILEPEIERELDVSSESRTEDLLRQSLFERLFQELQKREKEDGIKRTVTLDQQFRMHPVLGQFVSDTFYAPYGEHETFKSGRNEEEFAHKIEGYQKKVAVWVDLPFSKGHEVGGASKRRQIEARWIAGEAHRILEKNPELSLGVIAFYSAQVRALHQEMEKIGLCESGTSGDYEISSSYRSMEDSRGRFKERLRVGTVDAFQGKEFDVVILSMTRSNDYEISDEGSLRRKFGHLMLENRLCVAMSRQKRLLIVVGDSGMLKNDIARERIRGLVAFHRFCGGELGIHISP